MNSPSPATMAHQIDTARRVNRVQPNRLAYSTRTGDEPRPEPPAPVLSDDEWLEGMWEDRLETLYE